MEHKKLGNFPRPRLEITKGERHRVRSWTVQYEMRDVPGRLTAGAARSIFDFVDSREMGV